MNHKGDSKERICKKCSLHFCYHDRRQKFCSKKCRLAYHRKKSATFSLKNFEQIWVETNPFLLILPYFLTKKIIKYLYKHEFFEIYGNNDKAQANRCFNQTE